MPKVSVIIPVYNAHEYIKRCLDSVCNQTLKDIEIICVDDCSSDNSLDILNGYAKKDNRIKVFLCKTNCGESKARNIGLKNASGEFIAFVDNDDYLDLNFYEILYYKAIETNADIVKGEIHDIQYDGSSTYGFLNQKIRENNNKFYFAYHWWTAIYKRTLILENNIKLIEGHPLGGDILFLNQAIINCQKLELVDNVYYHYCRREDSGDSKILSFEKIKSAIDIFEKILNNIKNTGIVNKGTSFVVCGWLFQMLNYPFRTKEEFVLKYILRKILNYYQNAKSIICEDTHYTNILPIIMHLIKNNDYDEILEFYLKNNTQPKILIANLRFLHKQKGVIDV